MPITRTFVIAALSLGGASHGAFAQNYPARAARIIVPWTPGGTADLLARIAGQKFSETWGQQFIDRKSTRLNSSHSQQSRMPSSA